MPDEDLGPIDYLIVEFPGNQMTGEGLPILVDLVDRGIIRILDLLFVHKEATTGRSRSSTSRTSTATASSTSPCSRERRRVCSATTDLDDAAGGARARIVGRRS